jgi:methyltransferase (TIGR00027 family)
MIAGKPSYTAIHVAATRAAHNRFDKAPHLLEDQPALSLLGEDHQDLIDGSGDDAHWVLLENRLFIPLRARWVEDRLARAYESGLRQYIILGAGLDSFAFRQPDEFGDLSIIEIDHPNTQRWKRERIEALRWKIPANLSFTECDFEQTSMIDALNHSGFDANQPAFISWMGVTYYLERNVTQAALRDLDAVLAPRSEVAFDYLRPYGDLAERYVELEKLSGQYLKKKGEPHVNKLHAADVGADVLAAGFTSVVLETEETLREQYGDDLAGPIPLSERFGLAAALK